jgi:hypothetical protein
MGSQEPQLPVVIDVEVTRETGDDYLTVTPVWSGVDRARSFSVAVRQLSVASRLKAAILAGAAYPVRGVLTDVNGQTYVDFDHNVMGRHLNADLKKLGF